MGMQNLQSSLLTKATIVLLNILCCASAQAYFQEGSLTNNQSNVQQEKDVESITSAWKGHRLFAEWLVKTIQPTQIVDLGVDFGYSTFVFGIAARDNGHGTVTGIDSFEGDNFTGYRDTHAKVLEWVSILSLNNIEIIKGDFQEINMSWDKPIDILHIDGYHSYNAVYLDFTSWEKFVREDGVIIFHDINVNYQGFEVIKFFRELSGGHKLYFLESYGLGIYTKNEDLYKLIMNSFSNVYDFDETPL